MICNFVCMSCLTCVLYVCVLAMCLFVCVWTLQYIQSIRCKDAILCVLAAQYVWIRLQFVCNIRQGGAICARSASPECKREWAWWDNGESRCPPTKVVPPSSSSSVFTSASFVTSSSWSYLPSSSLIGKEALANDANDVDHLHDRHHWHHHYRCNHQPYHHHRCHGHHHHGESVCPPSKVVQPISIHQVILAKNVAENWGTTSLRRWTISKCIWGSFVKSVQNNLNKSLFKDVATKNKESYHCYYENILLFMVVVSLWAALWTTSELNKMELRFQDLSGPRKHWKKFRLFFCLQKKTCQTKPSSLQQAGPTGWSG